MLFVLCFPGLLGHSTPWRGTKPCRPGGDPLIMIPRLPLGKTSFGVSLGACLGAGTLQPAPQDLHRGLVAPNPFDFSIKSQRLHRCPAR